MIFDLDFEYGAFDALRIIFPNSQLSLYLFYHSCIIGHQIRQHGLELLFKGNSQFKQIVREIVALAFLPPEFIKIFPEMQANILQQFAVVERFIAYFKEIYIYSEIYIYNIVLSRFFIFCKCSLNLLIGLS